MKIKSCAGIDWDPLIFDGAQLELSAVFDVMQYLCF